MIFLGSIEIASTIAFVKPKVFLVTEISLFLNKKIGFIFNTSKIVAESLPILPPRFKYSIVEGTNWICKFSFILGAISASSSKVLPSRAKSIISSSIITEQAQTAPVSIALIFLPSKFETAKFAELIVPERYSAMVKIKISASLSSW